jgi:transcriptional regulator with XRE-family HTH domain
VSGPDRGVLLGDREARAAALGLQSLRDMRGWSQMQLAEELGVRQPWVSKRETGAMRISKDEAERLGRVLGSDAAGLLAAGEGAR